MKLLLQFDLFYTIIKIPNRFSDLEELENDFCSWVYNCEDTRITFENGTYGFFYDDNTFVEWLKNYKLKECECVEILKSHCVGNFDNSVNIDGKLMF